MPIGEPSMEVIKPKRKDIINITNDNLEADLDKAFPDIDKDMMNMKIEGDKNTPTEKETNKTFVTSVDKVSREQLLKDVDPAAVNDLNRIIDSAVDELREDSLIQDYIVNGHKLMIDNVIDEITMNSGVIIKILKDLTREPDKELYIEQETKRVTNAIKEVVITKLLLEDNLGGNS